MSYIPATTVKDGRTLTLAGVEWQVLGTDLVGETLVPSAYQAVATYSGKVSYSTATSYITTVEYVGDITRDEVESVTYWLTYLGEPLPAADELASHDIWGIAQAYLPYILCGLALTVAVVLSVCLIHVRRERDMFRDGIVEELDDSEAEVKK